MNLFYEEGVTDTSKLAVPESLCVANTTINGLSDENANITRSSTIAGRVHHEIMVKTEILCSTLLGPQNVQL